MSKKMMSQTFQWMSILLCFCFGLVACATPSTESSKFQQRIEILGLPEGVKSDITVTGPNGFKEKITETKVFENLALGEYTLAVNDVIAGDTTYFVIGFRSTFSHERNFGPIQVQYSLEAQLSLIVRGLPVNVSAGVTLKGVGFTNEADNIEQKITDFSKPKKLKPGRYKIVVADVLDAFNYTPRADALDVELEPGHKFVSTIDYMTNVETFAGIDGGNNIAVDENTMIVSSLTNVANNGQVYGKCYTTTYNQIGNCEGAVTIFQKDSLGAWKMSYIW
jgi:hypothetical protein